MKPSVGIVLPCYNEEEIIKHSFDELKNLIADLITRNIISGKSFIVFIDDGSSDKTWELILGLKNESEMIRGIKLATNSGHQNALLAGLFSFKDAADCLISIDADLQDDITVIPEMINKFDQGYEVVYGVRASRSADKGFKKNTAMFFYKLMRFLGVNIIYNHADFRLASRKVLNELERFSEVNLFLRGIFPLIGFRNTKVYYDRKERKAGTTKYPLKKMISFALNGITSFSIKPLRLITISGFIFFIVSILLSLYTVYSFFYLKVMPGWSSLMISVYFIGAIQLLGIGIIGEYIGKIYIETKRRPRFIIEDII